MDLKTKRKIEIDNQKEKRKTEIINAAIDEFKDKGIDNTKMTDIAERAQVGIVSVYRYFKTKPDLVIEAAMRLWQNEIGILYNDHSNNDFKRLNGLSQIREVLNIYIRLFENHQDFIRFVEEFDNYSVKERISSERLEDYENIIISLRSEIFDAIEAGKKDGSIRKNISMDVFYSTITHAFMSLCQKLVLRGKIIRSDSEIDAVSQIRLLIDISVGFIENK